MHKRLYSIRDKKAENYGSPVIFENDAIAIRSFGDLVSRDKESLISLHPSDFSLCFIGEFNYETGELIPSPAVVLCDGDNFVKE